MTCFLIFGGVFIFFEVTPRKWLIILINVGTDSWESESEGIFGKLARST